MVRIPLRHRHFKNQSWRESFYKHGTVKVTKGRGEFPASPNVLRAAYQAGFQLNDEGQRFPTVAALLRYAESLSAESADSTESAKE